MKLFFISLSSTDSGVVSSQPSAASFTPPRLKKHHGKEGKKRVRVEYWGVKMISSEHKIANYLNLLYTKNKMEDRVLMRITGQKICLQRLLG